MYVRENVEDIKQELQVRIGDQEGNYAIVIGGDFNARTANRGINRWVEGEDGETIRKSKDRILDKNEKILIEKIEKRGWILLNGNWEGDKDGEFTYIGKQG